MSKASQAFNDIMAKSTKQFDLTHLDAHLYFTQTMYKEVGITQYDLSDREKALIAYAIYIGLRVGKGLYEKS